MISGANEKELVIANARADIILKLDNTSTYESWLIIDTYIEELQSNLIKEQLAYINLRDTFNKQYKQLKQRDEVIDELEEFLKEYHNYENRFKWCEEDYIKTIEKIEEILQKYKGDNK